MDEICSHANLAHHYLDAFSNLDSDFGYYTNNSTTD